MKARVKAEGMRVEPGPVQASGRPAGVGCACVHPAIYMITR